MPHFAAPQVRPGTWLRCPAAGCGRRWPSAYQACACRQLRSRCHDMPLMLDGPLAHRPRLTATRIIQAIVAVVLMLGLVLRYQYLVTAAH